MAEENLELLFSKLQDESFSPLRLADDSDFLKELLRQADVQRLSSGIFLKSLEEREEALQSRIIFNIASLYPLSREIVLALMKKIGASQRHVLKAYDLDQKVADEIQNFLEEIVKNVGSTRTTSDYKTRIEKLRAELEARKSEVAESERLREECEELERRCKEGADARELRRLEEERAALLEKIDQDGKKKESLKKEVAELRKNHDEIKKELRELAKKDLIEQPELVKKIFKAFPEDAEANGKKRVSISISSEPISVAQARGGKGRK